MGADAGGEETSHWGADANTSFSERGMVAERRITDFSGEVALAND